MSTRNFVVYLLVASSLLFSSAQLFAVGKALTSVDHSLDTHAPMIEPSTVIAEAQVADGLAAVAAIEESSPQGIVVNEPPVMLLLLVGLGCLIAIRRWWSSH